MPHRFEDLPSLTRKEVLLWNWYTRIGPRHLDWKSWLTEIFEHLLEKPSGYQVKLVQAHLVDAQFGEKVLSFGSKQEIFIGRGLDNDVVLSANAVANRHTRVILKEGRLAVEDLGGKLGTYLSEKKIQPGEIHSMSDGDQLTVFPYRFRVLLERCWSPETDVAIGEFRAQALDGAEFSEATPPEWRVFTLNTHPSGEPGLLEVSRTFLTELQGRILGPLGLDKDSLSVPSDDALTGFIIFALLERLNRRLQFPVQFSLAKNSRELPETSRGMSLSVAVGVADLTGHFRLFLPFEFLSTCQSNVPLASAAQYPAGLPWIFPVSAGFVDLSAEEIAQVGLEDILVAQRAPAILLPNEFRNGWSLAEDGSNSARFMIDKYFERGVSVDTSVEAIAAGGKPDVDALPLRLHVILAEKEFTLGEIRAFSPGSIVELDVTKTDPVRLMVNGKILGEGELVDVEGNLGVKVLRWRDS